MERSTQNWVLAVTSLTGFLGTFIASAISIALPLIGEEFSLSTVTEGLISLVYVLAAGAILMPIGRVADLCGRKAVYLAGSVGFTVFTFACALAPSTTVLIALRALQGLAAALLFATITAMATLAYPPESRGRALGMHVSGIYLGMTLGPILGGILVHNFGWRGLFVVVAALSAVNTLLAFWKLHGVEWREPKMGRFDVRGSAVWAISLPILLMGFSYLPRLTGALLIAGGVVGLALFLWLETRAADPVLNVDLLRRNRVFASSNFAALVNYAATYAMTFLMSLYLQYNRGLDAQTAGFVLVAGTFVQAAISPLAGRLADRVEARIVASIGMALGVVGLLALVFLGEGTPYWYIIVMLCLLGLGFALFASPITHTIMGSVEKRHVGIAAATLATMRVAGQNISMGLATLVLAIVVGRHAVEQADYPHLLTSVRITFGIFAALCALGVAASLVGPRQRQPE